MLLGSGTSNEISNSQSHPGLLHHNLYVDNLSTYTSLDMIYYGLVAMARSMAVQYADGLANVEFWKESLYWYNLYGKVEIMHYYCHNFT